MVNFVMRPRAFDSIARDILEAMPELRDEKEFACLSDKDWEIPSVVVGALTRYLVSSETSEGPRNETELTKCYKVLEMLVTSDDPAVENLFTTDFIELLDEDSAVYATIESHLLPHSSRALEYWNKKSKTL